MAERVVNVGGWWVTDKTRTSPALTLERRELFVLLFSGSHNARYRKVLNITTLRNCWHLINKFNRYSRKLAFMLAASSYYDANPKLVAVK